MMRGRLPASQAHDEGRLFGAATPASSAERRRAVRQVAALSRDAVECAEILAALGLEPQEGVLSAERAS